MRTYWTILLAVVLGLISAVPTRAEDGNTGSSQDNTVSKAPAFELRGLDGKIYRLTDYRGSKPLIVWFTNLCGGCQANIPHLDSVYKADIKPQAELLAISLLGTDKETVSKIFKKLKFEFPILLDTKGKTCEDYVGQYVEASCPLANLFVIDRQGIIRYETHYPGYEEAEALSAIKSAIEQQSSESNTRKGEH